MTIKVGDKLPDVKLVKATDGGPELSLIHI